MHEFKNAMKAFAEQHGEQAASEFMREQMEKMFAMLPKTKQKVFMGGFKSEVGDQVKVKVKSLMTGKEVEIRWCDLGGPCDPSTELYWSM